MLSRVADHLYWMSRYLERAENTARIIDVYLNLILDLPSRIQRRNQMGLVLRSLALRVETPPEDLKQFLYQLTFDENVPASVLAMITEARGNARQGREQISSEMWLQLNRLYLDIQQASKNPAWWVEPHDFYMSVKMGLHLFQGLSDSTMLHNQGWHFIQIGRDLERISNLMSLLDLFIEQPGEADNHHVLDYFSMLALLKSATAFEAYCKVYGPDLQAESILEFLLFSEEFPHSAHFCVNSILNSINALSEATLMNRNTRLHRLVGRLQSNLSYTEISEVLENNFMGYLVQIRQQTHNIHDALYNTCITYPIEAALS